MRSVAHPASHAPSVRVAGGNAIRSTAGNEGCRRLDDEEEHALRASGNVYEPHGINGGPPRVIGVVVQTNGERFFRRMKEQIVHEKTDRTVAEMCVAIDTSVGGQWIRTSQQWR